MLFAFFLKWLHTGWCQGRRLNAVSLFTADFSIPAISSELFTLCEVVIHIEDPNDLEHSNANLSAIETEVRLGMESSYYARRILNLRVSRQMKKQHLYKSILPI